MRGSREKSLRSFEKLSPSNLSFRSVKKFSILFVKLAPLNLNKTLLCHFCDVQNLFHESLL